MAGTSKKDVKRYHSPQTRKRKRAKGGRNTKKTKKGAPGDFWQAALLTAVLIAVSALISMAALSIKRGKVPQLHEPADIAMPEPTAPEKPLPKTAAREERFTQGPSAAEKPVTVSKPPANKPDNRQPPKTSAVKPVPPEPAAPPKLPPKPAYQGTLVFIIDDAGNNLKELEPFLRFPGPLTIAILPGLPHSAEAARRVRAAGKEVFLHQPMEASGGQDPGPGAIYTGMNAAEITAVLRQNVAEIGPVAGMNNHQGSQVTMDQQIMETVLAFCREQGICFLDSRTTAKTAVPAAARNLGIKIGERNIFIDNEQDRLSMSHFIENGLVLASKKGSAVMIGHAWSPELAPLLTELYQNVIARGYTLATASDFIGQY